MKHIILWHGLTYISRFQWLYLIKVDFRTARQSLVCLIMGVKWKERGRGCREWFQICPKYWFGLHDFVVCSCWSLTNQRHPKKMVMTKLARRWSNWRSSPETEKTFLLRDEYLFFFTFSFHFSSFWGPKGL